MSLRHAVLGVLEARPMSGYELSQFLDSSTGWLWSASHSQIYPLLARLTEAGLVAGDEGVRGEQQRRITYHLTDAGRAELAEWVSTVHPGGAEKDAFWLQAVLLDLASPTDADEVLARHAADQRAIAARAAAHAEDLSRGDTPLSRERLSRRPASEHARLRLIKSRVFEAQAQVARTRAEWAESLRRELHELGDGSHG